MTSSYLKTLVGGLPAEVKLALNRCWDALLNNGLQFGVVDADAAQSRTVNLAGRYVKVTTSATASQEVAIAHGLVKTPSVIFQVLAPTAVNARFLGDLQITRAADETRLYLTSASTSATVYLYVE